MSAEGLVASWTPPLSTRGRYVVDANGRRFRFKSGNFHGASGTYNGRGSYKEPGDHHAGEVAYQTVLCLDRVPLDRLIEDFLELGINSIRLPFSNQMVQTTTLVPDHALGANPALRNKTPLEIFDAVVEALTKKGLAVILNNHTVRSIWCCGLDRNARWNIDQTSEEWIDTWVFMVKRYKSNTRVVGAELYNEVRRDFFADPQWGGGGSLDWYSASLQAATRIQREANEDILIIIEGINWVGLPISGVPHYRPELQPVAELSHTLPISNKLVYSAHFYAYTGPNATGADSGIGHTKDPSYGDLSPLALNATFYKLAGYVATPPDEPQKHYTAPVWISEFGVGGRNDLSRRDRDWWTNFIDVLIQGDFDYSIWPLVGWQENGQGDLWAFNAYDSQGQRLSIMDHGDWRLQDYTRLVRGSQIYTNESIDIPEQWQMLMTDQGSQISSNTIFMQAPLVRGEIKAACPDGLRLQGLSHSKNPRGLCTDATFGENDWYKRSNATFSIVTDEGHVSDDDWAKGYTKLQCPKDASLIGYSFTGKLSSAALCAPLPTMLVGRSNRYTRRTVWFDRASVGPSTRGSFAAVGITTGLCNDNEVAIGYAFTTRHSQGGIPSALLCQGFDFALASTMPKNLGTTLTPWQGSMQLYLAFVLVLFLAFSRA
ncbi:unnamed protein product [Sympodiomycopsis kandeliae]